MRSGVRQLDNFTPPYDLDGRLIGEASFALPADLPLGYHRVHLRSGGPRRPALRSSSPRRGWGCPSGWAVAAVWGLATQLYSVRSKRSWGVGDLTDLTDLAVWSAARHGAGYLLINPLHAAAPTTPMEPSPYLPTSRRFVSPLYLRVEAIPEYADLPKPQGGARAARRTRAAAPASSTRSTATPPGRRSARRSNSSTGSSGRPGARLAYAAFRAREGPALDAFATWCALAERHGDDWHTWPAALRHPAAEGVAAFVEKHSTAVDFHRWMQWQLDEQLADAQSAAVRAGMPLGIMADLAVGVHPDGADAWALQDVLALGVTAGAPPDEYNQLGQNWSQPPWRPDQLENPGIPAVPGADRRRTAARRRGSHRPHHRPVPVVVDPRGPAAHRGHLRALQPRGDDRHRRAGSATVPARWSSGRIWAPLSPGCGTICATVDCSAHRSSGSNSDQYTGGPLAAQHWREYCLSSVTTHDLPPTAGYLAGDHVRLRDSLGLLTRCRRRGAGRGRPAIGRPGWPNCAGRAPGASR